jgi:outer membrane protein OmpA-like peptidoglycan-associated protein
MGKSWSSWCGNERRARRLARRLVVLAVLLGLGACNPVETVRDWTGASQNDPDPDTTPNTRNLAAGEAADYPNLATVPPPPVRAMTAAERDKLTQSLIADRANARHTDEQLRAGSPAVSAAPPPPPSPLPTAHEPGGAPGAPPSPSMAAAAASFAAPAMSAAPPRSILPSPGLSPGGAGGEQAAALPSSTAANSRRAGGKALAAPGEGLRKQGEPPDSGPQESSLEMPQARAMPQPEQIQPAPPPPQLPPSPRVASTLPSGLAPGGVLAPTPPPEASGPAGFQPPPQPPELPPLLPSRSAAAGSAKSGPKPPAQVGTPVAEIKFGADSTNLSEKDRQTLETVVPLYQQNPGKVRIVGYAGAGSGAVEQLNSYRSALDRAQAVAAALTQAGIPSDKIQVEAAPAGANSGESRAEILLEH